MHLEAYVPIQSALIAYDVCRGLCSDSVSQSQFNEHFALKVVKRLEKLALRSCDLNADSYADLPTRKL